MSSKFIGLEIYNELSKIISIIDSIEEILTEIAPSSSMAGAVWRMNFISRLNKISSEIEKLKELEPVVAWKDKGLKEIKRLEDLTSRLREIF